MKLYLLKWLASPGGPLAFFAALMQWLHLAPKYLTCQLCGKRFVVSGWNSEYNPAFCGYKCNAESRGMLGHDWDDIPF